MKKTNRMSVRTAVLLVAALLLLSMGTYTGVRALPNITSDLYRAHFYLNHLQVHLLENGEDVCSGENTLDGATKVTGRLATELGYKSDSELGSVEPGKIYKEEIAAENGQDISQFVRMTIRKYWVETDEDGNVVTTTDASGKTVPKKTTALSPSLIHLMNDGKEACDPAWQEVTQERTTESRTYIYTKLLPGRSGNNRSVTEPVFRQLQIDKSVARVEDEPEVTKDGNKTIYTYIYKYDGYAFFIEADVQAIQTHNAQDAIESQWGPYYTATYNLNDDGTESGSLSVR